VDLTGKREQRGIFPGFVAGGKGRLLS
jgi:hypothetical protein